MKAVITDLRKRTHQCAGTTDPLTKAETGKTFRARLYHGTKSDPEKVYGRYAVLCGRDVPILGNATYCTTDELFAQQYGPVEQVEVMLVNPLVLESDKQWRELINDAHATEYWRICVEPSLAVAVTQRLQSYVRGQGHDGVVVRLPRIGEGERFPVKRLTEAFGVSQVVLFDLPNK